MKGCACMQLTTNKSMKIMQITMLISALCTVDANTRKFRLHRPTLYSWIRILGSYLFKKVVKLCSFVIKKIFKPNITYALICFENKSFTIAVTTMINLFVRQLCIRLHGFFAKWWTAQTEVICLLSFVDMAQREIAASQTTAGCLDRTAHAKVFSNWSRHQINMPGPQNCFDYHLRHTSQFIICLWEWMFVNASMFTYIHKYLKHYC